MIGNEREVAMLEVDRERLDRLFVEYLVLPVIHLVLALRALQPNALVSLVTSRCAMVRVTDNTLLATVRRELIRMTSGIMTWPGSKAVRGSWSMSLTRIVVEMVLIASARVQLLRWHLLHVRGRLALGEVVLLLSWCSGWIVVVIGCLLLMILLGRELIHLCRRVEIVCVFLTDKHLRRNQVVMALPLRRVAVGACLVGSTCAGCTRRSTCTCARTCCSVRLGAALGVLLSVIRLVVFVVVGVASFVSLVATSRSILRSVVCRV